MNSTSSHIRHFQVLKTEGITIDYPTIARVIKAVKLAQIMELIENIMLHKMLSFQPQFNI